MTIKLALLISCTMGILLSASVQANKDKVIELETTTIKGNTELPKYMYVVPWQENADKKGANQKLVLHNLYMDLFDPLMPAYVPAFERAPVLRSGPGSAD